MIHQLTQTTAINQVKQALSEQRVVLALLAPDKVSATLNRETAPSKALIDLLNNRAVQRLQDFTQNAP